MNRQLSPICFLPSGKLVCYHYGKVLVMNEGVVEKSFQLFSSKKETLLGRCRLAARLLRLGVRTAMAIDEENILLCVGNRLFEFNLSSCKLSSGFDCGYRVRPLIFSEIKGIDGFEDGIYFGEYVINMDKKPVKVLRRTSIDQWEVVYSFPQGAINHIHNVVPDSYRKCVWIFTGDFDESAAIWKATENFKTVERVACNNQKYRGCVVFVLPEGLLYATDAPFADDYIYLMNTETYETKEIAPISGSCIYGCKWKDRYVFSSTVESDGRNESKFIKIIGWSRGAGIKDDYTHLFIGDLKNGFKDVYREKKDLWSYLFQFAVLKFPAGTNNGDTLYFQPMATKKNDLCLMTIKDFDIHCRNSFDLHSSECVRMEPNRHRLDNRFLRGFNQYVGELFSSKERILYKVFPYGSQYVTRAAKRFFYTQSQIRLNSRIKA